MAIITIETSPAREAVHETFDAKDILHDNTNDSGLKKIVKCDVLLRQGDSFRILKTDLVLWSGDEYDAIGQSTDDDVAKRVMEILSKG